MSDFFSKVGGAIAKGVSDTANQVGKTANDIGEGIGNAVDGAGDAVAESIDHLVTETNKELNDVGEKAKKGDFVGAYIEASEFMSPGTHVAIAFGSLGVGKDDPVTQNLISAVANFAYGNPIGTVKDLFDVADALSQAEASPGVRPSESQTCERPARSAARRGANRRASKAETKAAAKEAAKAQAKEKAERVAQAAVDKVALNKAAAEIPNGGFAPSSLTTEDVQQLINQTLQELVRNPPTGNAQREFAGQLNGLWQNEASQSGFGGGLPCRDKPLGERTALDILNDPTLTFEDMVAMFMAKVIDDMEDEVKDQMKKMEAMQNKGSSSSEASGPTASGGATQGAPGGAAAASGDDAKLDEGLFDIKNLCADGADGLRNAGPTLSGVLDMVSIAAPVLGPMICGVIGACGGPAAIGGVAIGTVVGVGLSLLCQGGKLAIQAGALDGAADMLEGLGGGDKKAESNIAVGRAPAGATGRSGGGGTPEGGAGTTQGAGASKEDDQGSFNMEMEKLKLLMQRMQQMQQALSNVLNTMHEGAMNSIRNIK